MVTDVQCTIQTEMIHECIKGILYHCLYIASAHINQLLPCGNKLHLSAGGCIILEKSFLFNQQFDIFFLHRTRFRMLSQIDLLQQIHWKQPCRLRIDLLMLQKSRAFYLAALTASHFFKKSHSLLSEQPVTKKLVSFCLQQKTLRLFKTGQCIFLSAVHTIEHRCGKHI